MPDPLIFIDVSEVLEGRLEDAKRQFQELSAFVAENEPRAISYNVFFDEPAATVTVIQVHPDSESMEFHMQAAAHLFPPFAELLTMRTMDVYGEPRDALLAKMRAKATMLGAGVLRVHVLHAGFTRFTVER